MAYEVTPGYSGAIVTKPTVTRRSGRILKGCIGAQVSPAISALSFSLVRSHLIFVYFRPPRATSRQLLTRRASAAASLGCRATSASARSRLLMVLHLLVATAAVTSSKSFRGELITGLGGRSMTLFMCTLATEQKLCGLFMPKWTTKCTSLGLSVDEYIVSHFNVITCKHS